MPNNDDLYHDLAPQSVRRLTATAGGVQLTGHVEKVGTHAYTWAEGTTPEKPIVKPTPRHLAYAAAGVNQEIVSAEVKLNDLRKAIKQTADAVMDLDISVARMTNGLHAPGSELADAKEKIEELEKQVRGLIREAQRQKKRADRAEERAAITQPEIEKSKPGEVAFLRRTPGDAIRYFAQEVMKHAETDVNAYLMGASMGLRMVADDVDRLLQG